MFPTLERRIRSDSDQLKKIQFVLLRKRSKIFFCSESTVLEMPNQDFSSGQSAIKTIKYRSYVGRDGGLVVSVPAFYSDDPSSYPTGY